MPDLWVGKPGSCHDHGDRNVITLYPLHEHPIFAYFTHSNVFFSSYSLFWWLVWRSVNGVCHINKVKLGRSRYIIPIFSRPFSLAIPPWVGAVGTGKKRRVLCSSVLFPEMLAYWLTVFLFRLRNDLLSGWALYRTNSLTVVCLHYCV